MSIDVYNNRWLPKPSTFKVSNFSLSPGNFKVAMLRLNNEDWNMDLIRQLFDEDDVKDTIEVMILPKGYEPLFEWL